MPLVAAASERRAFLPMATLVIGRRWVPNHTRVTDTYLPRYLEGMTRQISAARTREMLDTHLPKFSRRYERTCVKAHCTSKDW